MAIVQYGGYVSGDRYVLYREMDAPNPSYQERRNTENK